jgi:hypothetical protein
MANSIDILIKAKDKASKELQKVQGSLKKFAGAARMAGVALTAVGVVGVAALKKLTSAAIEQRQQEESLRVAVENTGVAYADVKDNIMETIAAQQAKTNFGDEEQMQALTLMTAITGDLNKAMSFLPAVMDAAAAKGRGLKMIAGTLTRALDGQTDTAISLGMMFDKNSTSSERLAQVLGAVGGVAEAQADPLTQLGNDLGDVAQKFGAVLLPVITPVIDKIRAFAISLQELDENVIKVIMGIAGIVAVLALIGGPILLVVGLLPTLAVGFGIVTAAVAVLGGAFVVLAGVTGIGLIIAAVGLLALAWKNNWGGIQDKVRVVWFLIKDLGKWIGDKMGPIVARFAEIWGNVWDEIRAFTGRVISGVGDGFVRFVNMIIRNLNRLIKIVNLLNPFEDIPTVEEMAAGAFQFASQAVEPAVKNAQWFLRQGTSMGGGVEGGEMEAGMLGDAPSKPPDLYMDGKKVSDVMGDNIRTQGQSAG